MGKPQETGPLSRQQILSMAREASIIAGRLKQSAEEMADGEILWVFNVKSVDLGLSNLRNFGPELDYSLSMKAAGTPLDENSRKSSDRKANAKMPSVASVQKNLNPKVAAANKRGKEIEAKVNKKKG